MSFNILTGKVLEFCFISGGATEMTGGDDYVV